MDDNNFDWLATGFIAQRTPQWHAARKGRITASIAAACLGLDPYKSPAWAWRVVTGVEPDMDDNENLARGRAREPHARNVYTARRGVQIYEAGLYVHPALRWLCASPDGLVGHNGLFEAKAPKKLPDSLPAAHEVQCRIQIACTSREWCDYLSYAGPGLIREWRVVRDLWRECELLVGLKEWWETYVLGRQCPPRRRRSKMPDVEIEA
jgi:putative phage-type endonuclease